MTTERPRNAWNCRPSLFVSRMLGFALAMGVALAAVFLLFREGQVLWGVLAVPIGIWVGFKGGPLLLGLLSRAGVFGRVRIADGRLTLGRSGRAVELDTAFEVDARLQTSRIERTYDLKDMGVTSTKTLRKHTLTVKVLSVLLGQEGRRYQLVGDETNRAPGPDYETSGLAVRPLPVVNAGVPRARLWGADLAQVLGRLRQAAGYVSPAVGEQPEALEDPRKAFCPTWKVAAGTILVLGVFLAGSFAAYQGYTERRAAEWDAAQAAAEQQRAELEVQAKSLVGRRVAVRAQAGARMIGTVESYELVKGMSLGPDAAPWHVEVHLTVEELLDAEGNVLPEDAEVTYRSADNYVRRGDRIDDRASEVEALPNDAPASR